MRRKVVFYPLYQETFAIESVDFDGYDNAVSYTHHYTLKTPSAPAWDLSSLLRELADRLDEHNNQPEPLR